MFKDELENLLEEYKSTINENDRESAKRAIKNLISKSPQEFENFFKNQFMDQATSNFLKECYEQVKYDLNQNEKNISGVMNENPNYGEDLQAFKKSFLRWAEAYHNNGGRIGDQNSRIVIELIQFYVIKRFEILLKFLDINDTADFELFKNHVRNQLRAFFADRIYQYMSSPTYKEKGYFQKMKKRGEIKKLILEIDKYKFDMKKIGEVLQ